MPFRRWSLNADVRRSRRLLSLFRFPFDTDPSVLPLATSFQSILTRRLGNSAALRAARHAGAGTGARGQNEPARGTAAANVDASLHRVD